ncbi:tail fiber assembly protein [Type-D symbiont of Plautia stali]|uniref:tail fiber assembly protein n=1 Tax=Type-D symbiont of Plautia stali TaxID=1560356 RepID=UPI00073E483E|nr:tail fiber assembly protein [Type-D symbiont of Plautia stali]
MLENIAAENNSSEKYYYSITAKGFYLQSDMDLYANKPSDLIEIPEADYMAWCNPPEGYYQVFDDKGPRIEVLPEPDYQAIADVNRKTLLEEATQTIIVWQTKLLMGRKLSDTETESLNAWMDYIDVLNDTNISDAPNIQWPIKPTA